MKHLLLTPLQIHMAGIATLGLTTAAGYFLCIEPALDDRDTAMRQSAESANADRDAVIAEANLRAARRMLESRQSRLDALSFTLEPVSRTNDRMVRITTLAEKHALKVTALEPGSPVALARHTLVPMRLSGTCDYSSVTAFLKALRESFPDTRVDSLDVVSTSASDATFALECTWFAAHNGSEDTAPK